MILKERLDFLGICGIIQSQMLVTEITGFG
jgi:hypothetical protein